MNKAGTNSYYHYDGLGSTRQLTDSNEAVVANYTYDSFGSLIASSGTTENTYKFTGEEFDDSSGLLYLRARYYDSEVGRFIRSHFITSQSRVISIKNRYFRGYEMGCSRDPILGPMQIDDNFLWFVPFLQSDSRAFSSYNYTYNNPVNSVDPLGLKSECDKWKDAKDTDDGCAGILNKAQCAQCCVETFKNRLWFSPFSKWYGWITWVYGCKSICGSSDGKQGPDFPTP